MLVFVSRRCQVSFLDPGGIRHTATVEADTLFEAAVLAISAFRDHGCSPGDGCPLQIEVAGPTVTHTVTPARVNEWLRTAARSPADRIMKERLKKVLAIA